MHHITAASYMRLMIKKLLTLFLFLLFYAAGQAQETWDLRECVAYALTNNISVKQADIQARTAALQLKQSQAGQYPNANFSTNGGYNFGRSVNPATNTFESQRIFFSGFQLQSGVTLFNWFSQRYNVEAARLEQTAAHAAVDKARNDVALNVAIAYLQALLGNEQMEISAVQVQQTQAQLENSKAGARRRPAGVECRRNGSATGPRQRSLHYSPGYLPAKCYSTKSVAEPGHGGTLRHRQA
jgi:outer membrane protein